MPLRPGIGELGNWARKHAQHFGRRITVDPLRQPAAATVRPVRGHSAGATGVRKIRLPVQQECP
ncbi:hypothetical protein XAP412_770041 [Xanthomonas phaseoli pv. phaseoli]|uniref:Transposase n=1 Tax=Xanthomonas campestris pv. phaseoli TaxID=317013 RepID=A0AB38E4P3_XANCH|nr:hypothetical protein XAP6984_810042 [Xanthomonas phaseoli pv. phaseoli]SON90237.1 hypothetical protein XAP412_770041 [Xanthomonas phaseoli pv. phaseoli]SON92484.1 hypothetical protein XAP7430_770042 [Xanthomonas phaseoli pv. phaseoli]